MTPLPKHLEEMRDELVIKHNESLRYFNNCSFDQVYKNGFSSAADLMLADLESMAKALEFYAPSNSYDYDKTQSVNYIWNDLGKQAREALKNYHEKYGAKND